MQDRSGSTHSFRTASVDALADVVAGEGDAEALEKAASAGATVVGGNAEADPVRAYVGLMEALAMAVRWEPAVAGADPNPTRFRDAAKHRASKVLALKGEQPWTHSLLAAATALAELDNPSQVTECAALLMKTPLPVRTTDVLKPSTPAVPYRRPKETPEVGSVLALVSIDDQALVIPTTVRPNQVYRLGVTVRTDDWPADAETLTIDFLSVLPPTILELPPVLVSPERLEETTVLQLRGELSPSDKGEDITLRAAYSLTSGERRAVRVVGHNRIRLKTFDASTALPRYLRQVASRIHDMIGVLDTRIPSLSREDRRDFFTLIESLVRFGHRAMQEKILAREDKIAESRFQAELKRHFAADQNIGAGLWEGPRQAGGVADLGLGNVVLELKVEHVRPASIADAHRYVRQPAHYSSGKDCPVSILCILDDSDKESPPGIPANYLDWMEPATHGLDDPAYPSMIAVVIIPIRFPTPSTWSR